MYFICGIAGPGARLAFRIYHGYSLRKSSLKEQTANATCGPLQCILHWEIVRKVKRASFPCVAFFPCRLTFRTIYQYKIHWRGTACCVFGLCFQRPLSQAITLISPKIESCPRSGWPDQGSGHPTWKAKPAARDHKKSTENGKVRYSLCSRKSTRKLETHIYSLRTAF